VVSLIKLEFCAGAQSAAKIHHAQMVYDRYLPCNGTSTITMNSLSIITVIRVY